jgi:hypothetical protein
MINKYNFDDTYYRMVTIALCRTLNKSIRWINYFEKDGVLTGKYRVLVPFFTNFPGDERFAFDAFVDDIADKRVELNTDYIPRGEVTLTSFSPTSEEFANPNQYISKNTIINDQARKILSKIKAIPFKFNFEIKIKVASRTDAYKAYEKLIKFLYNYMFFNVEYYGLKIDAVAILPDDESIELPAEINLTSEKIKELRFNLTIQSYYPLYQIETDDLEICDNDSEIDWDYLGVNRPDMNSDDDLLHIRPVWWTDYLREMKELQSGYTYRTSLNTSGSTDVTPNMLDNDIVDE